MKTVIRIGIDLAKNVFQVHGVSADEKVVFSKRLRRDQLLNFFAQLDRIENCLVGMESCCGSDYWANELIVIGYDARIMNPRFVKAYVKSVKNDKRDAEAICEAVGRPNMRFVPVKSKEQLDMILLHRQREQLIKRRTAIMNQVRGILMSYGVIIAQGRKALSVYAIQVAAQGDHKLTIIAQEFLQEKYLEILDTTAAIDLLDKKLSSLATIRDDCNRLMSIPGIGIISATAIVAWFGDGSQFKCARDAAAYLGLVPDQHSSGNTIRLGKISKRGNRYLRTLLVLGAHADLRLAQSRINAGLNLQRDAWCLELKNRRHTCIAAVALAAKNLRTAWALLRDHSTYTAISLAA